MGDDEVMDDTIRAMGRDGSIRAQYVRRDAKRSRFARILVGLGHTVERRNGPCILTPLAASIQHFFSSGEEPIGLLWSTSYSYLRGSGVP
jgi:hypothetical protein